MQWDTEYQEGYGLNISKEYMAMVNGVDEQFGRIVDELEKQGLADNTLLFFSDHGSCLGANGQATKKILMKNPCVFL